MNKDFTASKIELHPPLVPRPQVDDELRRALLAVVRAMKKLYPHDYKRIVAEILT